MKSKFCLWALVLSAAIVHLLPSTAHAWTYEEFPKVAISSFPLTGYRLNAYETANPHPLEKWPISEYTKSARFVVPSTVQAINGSGSGTGWVTVFVHTGSERVALFYQGNGTTHYHFKKATKVYKKPDGHLLSEGDTTITNSPNEEAFWPGKLVVTNYIGIKVGLGTNFVNNRITVTFDPVIIPVPVWDKTETAAYVIDSTLKVGIGTTRPEYALEVNGHSKFRNSMEVTEKLWIGGVPATTSAHNDYKLAVKGKIISQKIITSPDDWADYVFEDSYDMMSLADLERYINLNKRLPGIPSADEVRREGIDVGEMNRLLLEKIEELTIRLIELEKKIAK